MPPRASSVVIVAHFLAMAPSTGLWRETSRDVIPPHYSGDQLLNMNLIPDGASVTRRRTAQCWPTNVYSPRRKASIKMQNIFMWDITWSLPKISISSVIFPDKRVTPWMFPLYSWLQVWLESTGHFPKKVMTLSLEVHFKKGLSQIKHAADLKLGWGDHDPGNEKGP